MYWLVTLISPMHVRDTEVDRIMSCAHNSIVWLPCHKVYQTCKSFVVNWVVNNVAQITSFTDSK